VGESGEKASCPESRALGQGFTDCLERWQQGDKQAYQRLFEIIFFEIRRMAARELRRRGHQVTWGTTDLANEIVVRILKYNHRDWKNREHFLNTAALIMFQILIDYGRKKRRRLDGQKRIFAEDLDAVEWQPCLPDKLIMKPADLDKLIDLRNAIIKLKSINERLAAIALMKLNLGMQAKEIAETLNIAENTVNNLWSLCKKVLARELKKGPVRRDGAPDPVKRSEAV